MQTKKRSNGVVKTFRDGSKPFLVSFGVMDENGHIAEEDSFQFDMAKTSEEVRLKATMHGFIQRISDAGAMGRDPNTGKPTHPSIRLAAMKKIADHYMTGTTDWNMPQKGGRAGELDQIILAAVVEATGKTHEEVRAMVAAGAEAKKIPAKAYLAALGTAKLVAPIVARIRGEQAGEDGDELLEGLMAEGESE